ncbi:hypothetical protein KUF71_003864 [Frankliniella fusca]|uniref:Uncharacterized protein n=1 Tax=Frankliniella fusca TaxID=407009 RepID=A0AAE1GTV7_9NEOP|nr:hypothetical protein KUF71_003864 [Frankliniella fusca]
MRRKVYLPSMVQAITVLTVLKMLTNAQTTCNQGIGRVVYERLPDQQLQGFDDDVVRDSLPPSQVLDKCQDICLRDRSAANNLVRACSSFDFQAGARIASFGGAPEYEESACFLSRESAQPEGLGNLVLVPGSAHFAEVCLSSSRVERECPNRRYVFERHPRKALRLPQADVKEVAANNRSDCEDRCLNEFSFVCRSATFDSTARTCAMSRFTRRTHPDLLADAPTSDYLENTCLNAERRCDATAVYVKEENKRVGGAVEAALLANVSLEECQSECLGAERFLCRALEYDEATRQCALLEEDSVSQRDLLRTASSPSHHLYDLVCLDNALPFRSDNAATSHLFAHGRRPDTAFQRYRNSRLGGDFHSEITGRSLSECLDECLRQASFVCRSAVYSDRFRTCRLSRFGQRDGHRVIYDADYDYYENLMAHYPDGADAGSSLPPVSPYRPGDRPDPLGQDSAYGRPPYSGALGGSGAYAGGAYPGGAYYPVGGGGGGSSVAYGGNTLGYSIGNYGGGGASGALGAYPAAGAAPYPAAGYPVGGFPPGYPAGYVGPSVGPVPAPGAGGYLGGGPLPPPGVSPGPVGPVSPVAQPAGFGDPFYGRPLSSRCDDGDAFRQVGARLRARRQFIRRFVSVPSLPLCERECADARDFVCRSFNFRPFAAPFGAAERENCELSDRDSRDLDPGNPTYFETTADYDFYERFNGRQGIGGECLDVSQVCSEDGMEFTLRTPEGFVGRIYTHGFYDRCFFRGNGGTVNVLRISGAQGYPDCGTQRFGDSMTNIVVVQFSDYVQTGRDKRYNLTCLFRGPGEAVVTSGYIGAGRSGAPIPIEYLPAENSLSSRVRLLILYQGRPTTTIAVGDPLTFRLEAQDGYHYSTDIFATNVIARDPYSGRSVQLIDRYGCPVDQYVFPGLDRSREGDGLEARFNAFKIPESNFLVFEATVRTCRDGCQPAYCTGQTGRSEPSFGRRRRAAEESDQDDHDDEPEHRVVQEGAANSNGTDDEEQVREMIEVFENRNDIAEPSSLSAATPADADAAVKVQKAGGVVLTTGEYYGLVSALSTTIVLLLASLGAGLLAFRHIYLTRQAKYVPPVPSSAPPVAPVTFTTSRMASLASLLPSKLFDSERSSGGGPAVLEAAMDCPPVGLRRGRGTFEDPSEPIYTDPSLFERPRSLRSIAALPPSTRTAN